jgi:threonine dehydrogenase-like Zn-dependent dehydrogenase
MRTLVFVEAGKLEWREVANARVQAGCEAVIRTLVMGRCDLDIGYVRGITPMPSGAAIGHEIIGEVIDVGDSVRQFKPGDIAIVPAQINCGTCRNCRRGFTGRCQSVPFAASYGMGREGDFGGGVADLVRVPFADAMLYRLPHGAIAEDWIGISDMAQDAYRAVGPQLKQRPGARVLVLGGLPSVIGIYAAGIAVACGATTVDYYDSDRVRLAEAAKYGANPIERGIDEPDGQYEIIVDSSITPEALIESFRFAEPEALVTSVTVHFGPTAAAPFMEAYHKGLHYRTGRPNCRQHMEAVGCLCHSGSFKPELIEANEFAYENAIDAWLHEGLRSYVVRGA